MTDQAKIKKQGAIRVEAIVPLGIVIGLIVVYFMLFFDMHLRRGLEYGATQANGAEVNIGTVATSLWNASVMVSNVEMTNPEMPGSNRLQIGSINFRMVWDALLRGKVVIEEASINGVQINTPRKRAGRVLPVDKNQDGEGYGAQVLAQMQQEFSGNAIGDLAAVAGGADPKKQLGEIGENLKSSTRLAEIQQSLDEKNKQWQSSIDTMPKGADFSALQQRLVGVKLDNLQDVAQIQASYKEVESIRKDFDTLSKSVNETSSALMGEAALLRDSFSDLDKIVKQDVSSLQARMHLPTLDVRTLSGALFGTDVLGKVQQARGYMNQARSYMPTKDAQKKSQWVVHRGHGHDFVFGKVNGYPAFWLRKARISSRLDGGASDLSGEILDMTSNPALVGRPMIATLKGNFMQQGISGIKAELVIDHTQAVPTERLVMEVGQYAVAGRMLVNSPSVELGFSQATGSFKMAAELHDELVDVRLNNQFNNVALETKAPSTVVREMISASVAGLNSLSMDAHVNGTWSRLEWQLSTNLAEALAQGMRRYLQEKIDDARASIEKSVNGKIADQRKRLETKQSDITASLKSSLAERQAQIEKLRAELDGARNKLNDRKNALVNTQQQKLKQESNKLLDGLRKKF